MCPVAVRSRVKKLLSALKTGHLCPLAGSPSLVQDAVLGETEDMPGLGAVSRVACAFFVWLQNENDFLNDFFSPLSTIATRRSFREIKK
jgi:hypothetical protein